MEELNDSFDSEKSDSLSDIESEKEDTKIQTNKIEKEEADKSKIENLELIKAIAHILETLLADNKNLINYKEIIKKQRYTPFSSLSIPYISIEGYLTRIQNYSNIEKSTLIISLIYIDRFCKISGVVLTYHNVHRILFISILLSIKYNEDQFYNNEYYAEIAGIKLKELNLLEYTFSNIIHFHFYIKDETYDKYVRYLNCNIK